MDNSNPVKDERQTVIFGVDDARQERHHRAAPLITMSLDVSTI